MYCLTIAGSDFPWPKARAQTFDQELSTLSDLDRPAAHNPRRIYDIEEVVVSRELAERLQCPPGETFLRFRMLRTEANPEALAPHRLDIGIRRPQLAEGCDRGAEAPREAHDRADRRDLREKVHRSTAGNRGVVAPARSGGAAQGEERRHRRARLTASNRQFTTGGSFLDQRKQRSIGDSCGFSFEIPRSGGNLFPRRK